MAVNMPRVCSTTRHWIYEPKLQKMKKYKAWTMHLYCLLIFAATVSSNYTVCPCNNTKQVLIRKSFGLASNYSSFQETCNLASTKSDGSSPEMEMLTRLGKGSLAKLNNDEKLQNASSCAETCARHEKRLLGTNLFNETHFWYGLRYRCNRSAWIWESGEIERVDNRTREECTKQPRSDVCSHIKLKKASWKPGSAKCFSDYRGFLCEYEQKVEAGNVPNIFVINPEEATTNKITSTTSGSSTATTPQSAATASLKTLQNDVSNMLDNAMTSNITTSLIKTNAMLTTLRSYMKRIVDRQSTIASENLLKTARFMDILANASPLQNASLVEVQTFARRLIEVSSIALDERNTKSWIKTSGLLSNRFPKLRTPISVVKLLSRVLGNVQTNFKRQMQITTDNINLRVKKRRAHKAENRDFATKKSGKWIEVKIVFRKLSRLLSRINGNHTGLIRNSAILSHSVYDTKGKKVSVPVTFTLAAKRSQKTSSNGSTKQTSCQFYNYTKHEWSPYGCRVLRQTNTSVTCTCNHTTTFAILLVNADVRSLQLQDHLGCYHMHYTHLAGYVCNSVSIIFLFLTILSFRLVQDSSCSGKTERHFTHINLSCAVLGMCVTLLFSEVSAVSRVPCVVVTFLSHFFLIATFAWMTVEGLILYVYILRGNIRNQTLGWIKYAVGWGAPVAIAGSTLIYGLVNRHYIYNLNTEDVHTEERVCWLTHENQLSWASSGPILVILGVNCVLLTKVLCVIVRLSRESKKYRPAQKAFTSDESKSLQSTDSSSASPRQQAIPFVVFAAFMKLFPLLGVTWVVGWIPTFFAGHVTDHECDVTAAAFFALTMFHTVLNGLQGLFVFVICVLKDKYVREALKRRLNGAFKLGQYHKSSRTSGPIGKRAMSA